MKTQKQFLAFIFFLLPVILWAQGTNCTNAISLTLDGVFRSYSVSSATGASLNCSMSGYSGNSGRVTFFRFTTDNTPQCVLLDMTTSSSVTMEIILYDDCISGTASPSGGISTQVMCMNDGTGYWATNMFDNLQPNRTYYMRVRTENGFSGSINIAGIHTTPSNDVCSGATYITSTPVIDNNSCHTPGPGVAASLLCATTLENTAWYTYIIQDNGSTTITIDNINCDNGNGNNSNGFQIGFFTGNCGTLNPLTCSSGAGGTVQATATGLSAGTRVYVAIDGYSGSNCRYSVNASNSITLPVVFKFFQVWKQGSSNLLRWTTSIESGNSEFVIERSIDGINYSSIGRVGGAGESETENQYAFEDHEPLRQAYYRIRVNDMNHGYSYSKVVFVSRAPESGFSISSVRISGSRISAEINSDKPQRFQVSILSTDGRLLKKDWHQFDKGTSAWSMETATLPAGMYILFFENEGFRVSKRFLKTN